MRKLYSGLVLLSLSLYSSHAALVLNEMMPCNVSTVLNEYQNYTGWIEIYNDSESPVNLEGYIFTNEYLKSGVLNVQSWTVSNNVTIPAYGYELFFFDEQHGEKHATYKIETEPGSLKLIDSARKKVSELNYQKMLPHVSWGKFGSKEGYLFKPSPGEANADGLVTLLRAQNPSFSTAPGFYTSTIYLSLQSEPGATVYYTTNGSEPTEQSTLYSSPIAISQTTVIRARAYRNNVIMSEIVTGSYIFNQDSKGTDYHSPCGGFTVPVVSISTAPDYFFGNQSGIYVHYSQDWKRPVNVEYFVNNEQVISQELDAAITGAYSRYYEQKSLKLTASKKLGNNKIPYDFFPVKPDNEYKSLLLRNGGNDCETSRIRDGFIQTLMQGWMNVDYQAYRPVALYINGEYWGQMSMMERSNKDFVYSNFGLSEEDIDLLKIVVGEASPSSGNANAYYYMLDQAKIGTTSPGYYEKMNRLMDMDEYIDYYIFQQYIVNTDWPGNNMKAWRAKNDGRFRWIVFDTDFGFVLNPGYGCDVNVNMIDFCLKQGHWTYTGERTVELYKNLMENETFRQKFLNKTIIHLGTTFTPSRVNSVLDSVYTEAASEICAHWKRFSGWDQGPLSHDFGNQRAGKVYDHLKDYFGLGALVNLSISANIPTADFIMNGDRLNTSKYNGKYFNNMDLNILPVAPAGYAFISWNISSSAANESLLDTNTAWRYYYEGNQPAGNWYESAYDDSAWDTGSDKFGYDTNNFRTYNVTLDYGGNPAEKYVTAYFRSSFTISDLSTMEEIQGNLLYDDGVVLFINGKEVQRINMPAGAISYETFAANLVNRDLEESFTIDKSYLQNGMNTIAVEVHQINRESSDLTFKLDLSATIISDSENVSSFIHTFNTTVTEDINLIAIFEKSDYVQPALFINELCASNSKQSGFHNEYGIYADWIEIYNAGDIAVDLAGMYLTEDGKQVTYQFPSNNPFETTILPGEYKIIWADKEMWQGTMHTNFKLTAETASTLILSQMVDGQKVEIDRVSYSEKIGKNKNESYGRVTDGASQWTFFSYCEASDRYLATPGEANGSILCSNAPVFVENIISDDQPVDMKLYPNPVKTFLNIVVNTPNAYSIQIFNDKGSSIEYLPTVTANAATLNVQEYISGVYIIKVTTKEAVLWQKFIKE